MAKTIQQAEAELRTAALDYATANAEYKRQWALHNEGARYLGELNENGSPIAPLHPETDAACGVNNDMRDALEAAARALAEAIATERRAEAL